jgi:hypothetical protein
MCIARIPFHSSVHRSSEKVPDEYQASHEQIGLFTLPAIEVYPVKRVDECGNSCSKPEVNEETRSFFHRVTLLL